MSAFSDHRPLKVGAEVPPEAQAILAHAFETFGSAEKAWHWLERPNTLLAGASPLQLLQTDPTRYELVEDELTRIDYGVFV
jgi:putative toxin-antitoxin system antitoxin component (TIGR02293 family)